MRSRSARLWVIAALAALLVGSVLRLMVGVGGVGDRSAAVMAVLLGLGVWAATLVLSTPRSAFFTTFGLMILLTLAALPARNAPEYDDREAFFRTDQFVSARVATGPAASTTSGQMLTLLVEPVYGGAQPAYGLAGEINGAPYAWNCAFRHGMQWLALPTRGAVSGAADVKLHVTGAPTREADYLLVYTSSVRGGFLMSLVGSSDVPPGATACVEA